MNRRKFITKTLLNGTGIMLGMYFFPSLIENATNYSKEELTPQKLLDISFNSLERNVKISDFLVEKKQNYLPSLHRRISKEENLAEKIKGSKEEIAEFVVKNCSDFFKKKPTYRKFRNVQEELKEKINYLERIKNLNKIEFLNLKRDILIVSNNFEEFNEPSLKEFYEFEKYLEKIEQKVKLFPETKKMKKTIKNLSSDSSFIKDASNISKIPIEEIVAFSHIESNGNEFEIGRLGEINRFQLNPKYIEDIYRKAILQKNDLSGYILDKKIKKNRNSLLEALSLDSELNIAIASNFMLSLKDSAKKYYQYVLSYNRGVGRVKNLPKKITSKLENPSKIKRDDLKNSIFSYYSNFLDAKRSFKIIQNSL